MIGLFEYALDTLPVSMTAQGYSRILRSSKIAAHRLLEERHCEFLETQCARKCRSDPSTLVMIRRSWAVVVMNHWYRSHTEYHSTSCQITDNQHIDSQRAKWQPTQWPLSLSTVVTSNRQLETIQENHCHRISQPQSKVTTIRRKQIPVQMPVCCS